MEHAARLDLGQRIDGPLEHRVVGARRLVLDEQEPAVGDDEVTVTVADAPEGEDSDGLIRRQPDTPLGHQLARSDAVRALPETKQGCEAGRPAAVEAKAAV